MLDLPVLRELHQFIKEYLNQRDTSHQGMYCVWNSSNYHRLSLYISIYLPIYVQITYSYAFLHIYMYTCVQAGIHVCTYSHIPVCKLDIIFLCCKWPRPNPWEMIIIFEGKTTLGGMTTRAYSVKGRVQVKQRLRSALVAANRTVSFLLNGTLYTCFTPSQRHYRWRELVPSC